MGPLPIVKFPQTHMQTCWSSQDRQASPSMSQLFGVSPETGNSNTVCLSAAAAWVSGVILPTDGFTFP